MNERGGTLYATVAVALPFKYHTGGSDGLTYLIPEDLLKQAQVGTRVLVPLGKQIKTGVLVARSEIAPQIKAKILPIKDVLDTQPIFDEKFLEWTKWIAMYYMSSWGEVLAAALPEGLKPETRSRVFLASPAAESFVEGMSERARKRAELLMEIAKYTKGVSIGFLQKALKVQSLYATLHGLEEHGLVRIERPLGKQWKPKTEKVAKLPPDLYLGSDRLTDILKDLEKHAPRQANILLGVIQQMQVSPDEPLAVPLLLKKAGASIAAFNSLKEKDLIRVVEQRVKEELPDDVRQVPSAQDISNLTLSSEQQHAVREITTQLNLGEAKTFLLHGVTGSGKTEVYTALTQKVVAEGGGVLILVPEIALTPQLIARFRQRLSIEREDAIAVLHSRMTMGERTAAWASLASGRTRIAIGARSAVFAPIQHLRLIIVDEEHEGTYKQFDKTPRYNARDIAVARAAFLKGVCILGSATPSMESYYNAMEGKYALLELKQRVMDAKLPSIEILDVRSAIKREGAKRMRVSITLQLQKAIDERLARKEGIVLLHNRRGFSTYMECIDCGTIEMCPNCSVTMTFHQAKQQMRCHYCGHTARMRTTCAACGSANMLLGGLGTQRVEEDLATMFPGAKVLRMDLDTTSKKGSFTKILTAFAKGEADILLGTQMVAKGLDFPRVTLVGVISADTGLSLPDFRSSERTFQLLSQVSGRAGRTEALPGEVLIQTMQPGHPSIVLAAKHDFVEFYTREIEDRKILLYPPFSRLVLIEFRGLQEALVEKQAEAFASLFPSKASFYERIGPAAPSIPKLRSEYRWHVLLKNYKKSDPNGEKIRRLITGAIDQYQARFATPHVKLTVDVDVQGVL